MASNQTANFGLNQWAAEDQVLREEFNADNAKIDAALGAVTLRPALEVIRTLENQTSGTQLDIDLSDIDLNQYLWLRVSVNSIPLTDSVTVAATINGEAENGTYFVRQLNTSYGMGPANYAGQFESAKVNNNAYTLSGDFTFDCSAPWLFGEYRAFYYDNPRQEHWSYCGNWAMLPERMTKGQVQFLRLSVRSNRGTLEPGGVITVYGQKLHQN